MSMSKSTADLDAELAALSDRAEALAAELARRQAVERAWEAGKRVELGSQSANPRWIEWPYTYAEEPYMKFTWCSWDYRIAPEAPQAPDAVYLNLDSFGPARTPGGVTRIAFASRDEARKAVLGRPGDRVARYTRETTSGGWADLWVNSKGDSFRTEKSDDAVRLIQNGWKRYREVKT